MLHSPSPALSLLKSNTTTTAFFIRWDTAVMLRVMIGDVVAATATEGHVVSTNVPTHVVIFMSMSMS